MPIESIRPGLKSRKRINYFRPSKKNIIEFLGLNEQAFASAFTF